MTRSGEKNMKGFTLIELLIVIAIIGILASVVLVSLSSARTKARNNKALAAMKSAFSVAQACVTSGKNLAVPGNRSANPGGYICVGGPEIWPDLTGTDFNYFNSGGSNYSNGSVYFGANVGVSRMIFCGQNVVSNWWNGTIGDSYWNFSSSAGCKTYGF